MEMLISPKPKIAGCEINIPNTVLLEKAKPKYFLRNDKDGCIEHIMRNKLFLKDICYFFTQVANDRFTQRLKEKKE